MSKNQLGFNPDYENETITFEEVVKLDGLTLLEFGTPWCGHCQAARPAIEAALTKYANFPHIKIFDGKGKRLGRVFKVKLWPTLILLHQGKEVARLIRPLQVEQVCELIQHQ